MSISSNSCDHRETKTGRTELVARIRETRNAYKSIVKKHLGGKHSPETQRTYILLGWTFRMRIVRMGYESNSLRIVSHERPWY
jgi:hypothetical protein